METIGHDPDDVLRIRSYCRWLHNDKQMKYLHMYLSFMKLKRYFSYNRRANLTIYDTKSIKLLLNITITNIGVVRDTLRFSANLLWVINLEHNNIILYPDDQPQTKFIICGISYELDPYPRNNLRITLKVK